MIIPPLSDKRRIEIANHLRRLGASDSFLGLCRVLKCGGIALASVAPTAKGRSFELAMEANNVPRTFREFGLAEDVARWMRRWDELDYSVPLTTKDQTFLISRHWWMCYSEWEQDVPRERWPEIQRLAARVGANPIRIALAHLFEVAVSLESARVVNAMAAHCGMSTRQLCQILGPCDSPPQDFDDDNVKSNDSHGFNSWRYAGARSA